jgi:hypothetical protein
MKIIPLPSPSGVYFHSHRRTSSEPSSAREHLTRVAVDIERTAHETNDYLEHRPPVKRTASQWAEHIEQEAVAEEPKLGWRWSVFKYVAVAVADRLVRACCLCGR